MTSKFRFIAPCLALLGCLFGVQAVAQTSAVPPPIEHFFANPVFSDVVLSPSAKFLAVRFGSEKERNRLAVVDLVNNKVKVVAAAADGDIGSFTWVNDKRLVFETQDNRVAPGNERGWPGLFAVNRDGGPVLQLVGTTTIADHDLLSADHFLAFPAGKQDTDSIYLYRPYFTRGNDADRYALVLQDTVTGRSKRLDRPGATLEWMADRNGELRLTSILEKNMRNIMYLDPSTKQWRSLGIFDDYIGSKGAFDPLAFGDNDTLYVSARAGKDTVGLHTFDLKTTTLNPTPLVALEGFDFSGSMVFTDKKLLGIRYLSDAQATVWLDEDMKKVQAKVDALLPGTANIINVARRAEMPWVLVTSYSDRQPAQFALFNTDTGKLNPVGETHPQIKAAEMAEQELVRIKARDGLQLPVWMTVPAGERKMRPMVVMVHGGPYVRGVEWGWSPDTQFLASRGYVVLEPEFRGSAGYGSKHFRAGWKEWGLGMQNDIADATRWAIAQGIADSKRICIAGASYGGYAAMMGLINDPDLYQCGINMVGVTDLTLMLEGNSSFKNDMSQGYLKYGAPALIGDPVADAERFAQTSPLKQAARIKQPLLLGYGAVDRRVPLYHGRKFYEAVKQHNPKVEMVVYDDEAHSWVLTKTKVDFWRRAEKFLAQYIGPAADVPKKAE